jgi:hypothetical protein
MSIQIRAINDPVVFTNNAGGGANEIQAPENGTATMPIAPYQGEMAHESMVRLLKEVRRY